MRLTAAAAYELATTETYAKQSDIRERAFRCILRAASKRLTPDQTREVIDELLQEGGLALRGFGYPIDDGVNAIAAGIAVDLWGDDEMIDAPAEGEEVSSSEG